MRWFKYLIHIFCLVLLSACGSSDMADLREYVAQINARKNTDVPPLPEFKHIPSYFYEVDKMRDPFLPFLEEQEKGLSIPSIGNDSPAEQKPDCPRPDPYRVRAGLEMMPLDSLKMVGTLREENQKETELWGLVVANDGTLYRVHTGDYMGVNSGKVIGVYEDRIELMELLPDKEGCFKENFTKLALSSTNE